LVRQRYAAAKLRDSLTVGAIPQLRYGVALANEPSPKRRSLLRRVLSAALGSS
jgi:hypothetical protein